MTTFKFDPARYEGATPGPWRVREPFYVCPKILTLSSKFPGQVVADTCASTAILDENGDTHDHSLVNARLIADAPDLLAEVVRLRAENEWLLAALTDLFFEDSNRTEQKKVAAREAREGKAP